MGVALALCMEWCCYALIAAASLSTVVAIIALIYALCTTWNNSTTFYVAFNIACICTVFAALCALLNIIILMV